ncbi:hypothetical protein AAHA92_10618 [Salvia divinorum]|uniref:GBF-interacting protein 1 N-terminal domain-containing protein n=1 Tax=Salvia divinorum TaxID=28513 RepID=A0ABD1HVC2_SALDI
MSTDKGSGDLQSIPEESRKLVARVKEIVSCSVEEIYAALKEFNNDLDATVNFLLGQASFVTVKSKRDRRRENRAIAAPRPRGITTNTGSSSKTGGDRYPHGSTHARSSSSVSTSTIVRSTVSESSKDYEAETSPAQNTLVNEKWPILEKPPATQVQSEKHPKPSSIPSDSVNRPSDVEVAQEDDNTENSGVNAAEFDSIFSWKFLEGDSGGVSLYENDLHSHLGLLQHQSPRDFHQVSSASRNLQQLNVEKDEGCSNLRFGSFGSGMGDETNLEGERSEAHILSAGKIGSSTDHYDDKSLNSSLFQRSSAGSSRDHDPSSASQQEELKPDNAEGAQGSQHTNATFNQKTSRRQYPAPSSLVSSASRNLQQLNVEKDEGCSDLRFGSFGSGTGVETNLEEERSEAHILSAGKIGSSTDHYDGKSLNSSFFQRSSAGSSRDHDPSSASRQEELKPDNAERAQGSQHTNATFNQKTSRRQYLAPPSFYDSIVRSATYGLPSTVTLATNPNFPRECELYPSYSSAAIGHLAISTPAEAPPQIHAGTGNARPPSLPREHFPHPFTQPTAPFGRFANLVPYTVPQSSSYPPSTSSLHRPGADRRHEVVRDQFDTSLASWLQRNPTAVSAVNAVPAYNHQGQNLQPVGFRQGQQQPPTHGYGAPVFPDFYHPRDPPLLPAQQQQGSHSYVVPVFHPRDGVLRHAQQQQPYQGQSPQSGGPRLGQQQLLPSHSYAYGAPGYPNSYHPSDPVWLHAQQQEQQQQPHQGQTPQSGGSRQGQQPWWQQQKPWK